MNSFWIILLALGLYGLLHSLMASLWAKELARRWFGAWGERAYRLFYSAGGALTFLPVLGLLVWLPDQALYHLALPWSGLFLLIQASGLALFGWALASTDLWAFIGVRQVLSPAAAPERLVISGPYRWMRHPLYTASLLVLWFMPGLSLNLLALNLGVTAYLVIGGYFEERKLLRQFGAAYAEYQQRTPMFIPGLRLGR